MRWAIEGFSQKTLLGLGLDAVDAIILRFVADFYLSGKMETREQDGKTYYWLHFSNLISELPSTGLDKAALNARINRYVASGLMEMVKVKSGAGSRAYIRFVEDVYSSLVTVEEFDAGKVELTSDEKLSRDAFKDMFFKHFSYKAMELVGEPRKTPWGAREAALLKGDLKQIGYVELVRCLRLFFSDYVSAVKEFVRTKDKAGYSYIVFHSMIPKLTMARGDPAGPCEECGMWEGAHLPSCSVLAEAIEKKRKAREEEIAECADVPKDIMDKFYNMVKHNRET